jgi:hypothetical protein
LQRTDPRDHGQVTASVRRKYLVDSLGELGRPVDLQGFMHALPL